MSGSQNIELLVHNVSHSDLILNINNSSRTLSEGVAFARPKFSHFREITEHLHTVVENEIGGGIETALFPVHDTNQSTTLLPVGFRLKESLLVENLSSLRFRRDDQSQIKDTKCCIDVVYFPLLAILLPRWLDLIKSVDKDKCSKKIIILITGRGTPMDQNTKMIDNSTKYTGKLMKLFISREYLDIEVRLQHSTCNLFRYDENVVFVKNQLRPLIDSYRDELAKQYGSKWKEYIQVAIAFADGSSARISAIQASLRNYRPQYFHFWQLKSFWNSCKICFNDIECHSFDVIAAEPAISPASATKDIQIVVQEMDRFREDFIVANSVGNDLASFWLRKSGKPVLSVLLVQKPGKQAKLYRGSNVEVSMPTGSLCAERNVIGTALADDLTLKRSDIRVIAVYSMPQIDSSFGTKYVNTQLTVDALNSPSLELQDQECHMKSDSPVIKDSSRSSSFSSNINDVELCSSPSPRNVAVGHKRKIISIAPQACNDTGLRFSSPSNDIYCSSALNATGKNTMKESISSNSNQIANSSRSKRLIRCQHKPADETLEEREGINFDYSIVDVDENDINPLKPCGACNEWLKKIAECNPQLKVVTFTDYRCSGIYIDQIAD